MAGHAVRHRHLVEVAVETPSPEAPLSPTCSGVTSSSPRKGMPTLIIELNTGPHACTHRPRRNNRRHQRVMTPCSTATPQRSGPSAPRLPVRASATTAAL